MIKDLKVGQFLENIYSYRVAKVAEINDQWGWVRVVYLDGKEKQHGYATLNHSFIRLSPHETADYFLMLEKVGITDSWSE